MGKNEELKTKIMKYAIDIAVFMAVAVTIFLGLQARSESYSALYIKSHSNYIDNGTVSFVYGVDRFGPDSASYMFEVLVRGKIFYTERFEMDPGTRMREVSFRLNETSFPVKVQLVLRENDNVYYEAYLWLRGSRE